jgi:hypothetical protein
MTVSNSVPPPPVGTTQSEQQPPPADASAAGAGDAPTAAEVRTGSVPPPPPRRHVQESTIIVSEQRPEQPPQAPPQRTAPVDLPVIPRLDPPRDLPRVSEDDDDEPTIASTIPPAGRSTFIRSPSEVLSSRGAPAATAPPENSAWASARARVAQFAQDASTKLPHSIRSTLAEVSPSVLVGTASMGVLILGAVASAIYGLATVPSSAELAASAASAAPSGTAASAAAPSEPSEPAAKIAPPVDGKTPRAALDESTVLLDLSESMLAQRRDADALPPLERLVARRPELKDNERLGRILIAAAASNDRLAAAKSHALLTGPMGEAGAALVYELSLKTDVRDGVRQRAEGWLASKDFDRVAPLPVYAAVRLRKASSCEDKRALLDFAAKAGGKYVLTYLKEIESKKACAPDDLDCYSCLRSDPRLSQTIAKLEGR